MQESSDTGFDIHRECGPLLLLAGPGTGKTYKLAQRIKYLVDDEQVDPTCITVMTFTSAAAMNMRNRISDPSVPALYLPSDSQPINICTIHSLGHRIVCEKTDVLSLPKHPFVVRSDDLLKMLLSDAAQLAGYQRNNAIETALCRRRGECDEHECRKCEICKCYQKVLSKCAAIDHDDQIILASRLLAQDKDLLSKYQHQCFHLLIDEYQDINPGQYKLIRILSANNQKGLFAVGDDDQSIYSWRGASTSYIRNFVDEFKDARSFPLTHSYRCRRSILGAALCVVQEDEKRIDKGKYTYESSLQGKVEVHSVPSDKREAQIIRSILEQMEPSETALVLVPNRFYLPLVINKLRASSLEYASPTPRLGGGLMILASLSNWIYKKNDSLALRDCIEAMLNSPRFGVPSAGSRTKQKQEARSRAYSCVTNLWNTVNKSRSLWDSLEQSGNSNELLREIHSSLKTLKESNNSDISGFLACANDVLHPWRSIKAFRDEIEAWVGTVEEGGGGQSPRVRVMTLSGAKGLEADFVCVVGLEEGAFPRSDLNEEQLAEKRRLLFVSMTRAKKELHLFHARKRSGAVSFQGRKGSETIPRSSFLESIDEELIKTTYHQPINKTLKQK